MIMRQWKGFVDALGRPTPLRERSDGKDRTMQIPPLFTTIAVNPGQPANAALSGGEVVDFGDGSFTIQRSRERAEAKPWSLQRKKIGAGSAALVAVLIGFGPVNAHAQFRYGHPIGGPVFRPAGPVPPAMMRPFPYGSVVQSFRSLPGPVTSSAGNAIRSPSFGNAARATGMILFYPQRAY